MRRTKLWWVTVALVLVPATVLAGPSGCLLDSLGNLHFLEVLAVSEAGLISLVGEVAFAPTFNDPASCPRAPLAGTARPQPDGTVLIGYTAFASTSSCFPVMVQLSFSVSSFTGVGSLDEVNSGFFSNVTFGPASCTGLAIHRP
jgi:hypothetical protein